MGVVHDFDPPGPSRTPGVDNALVRLSHSYYSLKNLIGFKPSGFPSTAQSSKSNSEFLSPSYYERDPRGAIEVFKKDGFVVCRVYVACRERSSQILFPLWMKRHAHILSETCALSNFRFIHISRLINYPRSTAVYDWLAPSLPAPALRVFVTKPLSYFFAPNNSSKSKLDESSSLQRSCFSPDDTHVNSTVCGEDPEPRISKPLFILDNDLMDPSLNANSGFEEALQFAVRDKHATEAAIISVSSEILQENKLCLRSIISAPSADFQAGETISSPTSLDNSIQKSSDAVQHALDEADHVIEDEIKRRIDNMENRSIGKNYSENHRQRAFNSSLSVSTTFENQKVTRQSSDHSGGSYIPQNGFTNKNDHHEISSLETKSSFKTGTGNSGLETPTLDIDTNSLLQKRPREERPVSVERLNIAQGHNDQSVEETRQIAKTQIEFPVEQKSFEEARSSFHLRDKNSDPTERTAASRAASQESNFIVKWSPERVSASNKKGEHPIKSQYKVEYNKIYSELNHSNEPPQPTKVSHQSITGSEQQLSSESVDLTQATSTNNSSKISTGENGAFPEILSERPDFVDKNSHMSEKDAIVTTLPSESDRNRPEQPEIFMQRKKTEGASKLSTKDMELVMKETIGDSSLLSELFDITENISAKFQIFNRFKPATNEHVSKNEPDETLQLNGGIELFTHRSINVKTDGQNRPQNIYGVCRFYKTCRTSDGTFLFPDWIKKFKSVIAQYCGSPQATFIPTIDFDLMYQKLSKENAQSKEDSVNQLRQTVVHPELDADLIGSRVYRAQQQHFVTDLFHDGIHSIDAILNYGSTNESKFRRACIYRTSHINDDEVPQLPCQNALSYNPSLQPAFIMHDLVNTTTKATKFIRGLISMIPPKPQRGQRMVFTSQLSKTGEHGATCFRSVLITRNGYPPQSVLRSEEKNSFFEHNRLNRKSIHEDDDHDRGASINDECQIKVTVLEPHLSEKRKERPGTFENEDEVLKQADKEFQTNYASYGKNSKLLFNKFHQGDAGVLRAAQVMQESQIIIGGNDPSMASIMFARPETVVIEVQPFGYSTGPYRNFAKALNLTYIAVMSHPDETTFVKCAKDKFEQSWNENVPHHEMEAHMNGLITLYKDAAKKYDGSKSEIDLTSRKRADGTDREGFIPLERVCVRLQRLTVDVKKFGSLIAEKASLICKTRNNRV